MVRLVPEIIETSKGPATAPEDVQISDHNMQSFPFLCCFSLDHPSFLVISVLRMACLRLPNPCPTARAFLFSLAPH